MLIELEIVDTYKYTPTLCNTFSCISLPQNLCIHNIDHTERHQHKSRLVPDTHQRNLEQRRSPNTNSIYTASIMLAIALIY